MKNRIKKRPTTLSFGMKSKEFVKSPLDAVIKFELIPIVESIQVLKAQENLIFLEHLKSWKNGYKSGILNG
jgi:hypothetical protein